MRQVKYALYLMIVCSTCSSKLLNYMVYDVNELVLTLCHNVFFFETHCFSLHTLKTYIHYDGAECVITISLHVLKTFICYSRTSKICRLQCHSSSHSNFLFTHLKCHTLHCSKHRILSSIAQATLAVLLSHTQIYHPLCCSKH